MGIVLVYRSTRVINFAVGQHGLRRRRDLRPARGAVRRAVLARRRRRPRPRDALRRGHRADRDPPAVHRAAGDRAGGHDRHRPALASRSCVAPRDRRPRRPVPRRRSVPSGRSPTSGSPGRSSPSSSWCRSSPSAWVGSSTARPSARRQGVGREPRPGPPRRHQPEGGVDARVGHRRWPGHAVAVAAGRRRPARPRTSTTSGPSTLARALAAAVIAGMVSFPRAFFAGIAIGVVQALISFNYLDQPGLIDFLVFLAVLVAVVLAEPAGRGRDPDVLVRAQGRADPRAAAQRSGGSARSTASRLVAAGRRRRRAAAGRHRAVPPPAVHDDPRLRHLRPVAHRPHRLGRPAVARPDGLRRHRRAAHRRVHPGHQRRHRVRARPVPPRRDRGPAVRALARRSRR